MVPPAVAAHLDDVHAELRKLTRQCEQLPRCAGPPVDIAAEAVAEGVAHARETLALAHGTGLAGGLAVVARRADEIGLRVADVDRGTATGRELGERRPAGEGVVDHRAGVEAGGDPPRRHGGQGTPSRPRPGQLVATLHLSV